MTIQVKKSVTVMQQYNVSIKIEKCMAFLHETKNLKVKCYAAPQTEILNVKIDDYSS